MLNRWWRQDSSEGEDHNGEGQKHRTRSDLGLELDPASRLGSRTLTGRADMERASLDLQDDRDTG
ncbi:MAG: hypothetical protein B7Z12_21905 [Caulobacter vibrioides]|uniref:Uncharacterized protein n=1 Tax=Caulobacter vibrioides TaxID=155892 RepID=A0A258CPC7_CAUVI|nr:MAG: hypothetical protein B7Z12_21905 [Caulobacter vibrioides]